MVYKALARFLSICRCMLYIKGLKLFIHYNAFYQRFLKHLQGQTVLLSVPFLQKEEEKEESFTPLEFLTLTIIFSIFHIAAN